MINQKPWTEEEINILIEKFPHYPNEEIIKLFPDRNQSSIENKAHKLHLVKTKTVRSFLIGKRNKMVGRDLSYEVVKDIAKQYKTRGDFQERDSSAYVTARVNKWLDEICKHMFKQSYSTPQLIMKQVLEHVFNQKCSYNDRRVIKPYEIDVFFKGLKIGFEYDGTIWHDKNGFGKDKIDKYKLCLEVDIKLFTIKQEGTRRDYENEVKNGLCKIIPEINKATNLSITEKDINNVIIDYEAFLMNIEEIKEICSKYDNLFDFKKEYPKIYAKLCKNKLLKEYTGHMKRKNIEWSNEELQIIQDNFKNLTSKEMQKLLPNRTAISIAGTACEMGIVKSKETIRRIAITRPNPHEIKEVDVISEISKYTVLSDLIKNSHWAYDWCLSHNRKDLYSNLIQRAGVRIKEEDIIKEISKYKYFKDFRDNSPKAHAWCKHYDKKYLYKDLISDKDRKALEREQQVIEEVSKHKILQDFIEKANGLYQWCLKNNKKQLYANLISGKGKVLKSIECEKYAISEIAKYEMLIDFIKKSSKAYGWCIRNNKKYLYTNLKRTDIKYNFHSIYIK